MSDPGRLGLAREASIFARHITGADAPDYVVSCYLDAHARGCVDAPRGDDGLDALLLRVATTRPLTSFADLYARLFRKGGTLRRKLVLMAAILESAGPTQSAFEPPPPSSAARVFVSLAARAAVFGLHVAAALILLMPAHLLLRLAGRTRARAATGIVPT